VWRSSATCTRTGRRSAPSAIRSLRRRSRELGAWALGRLGGVKSGWSVESEALWARLRALERWVGVIHPPKSSSPHALATSREPHRRSRSPRKRSGLPPREPPTPPRALAASFGAAVFRIEDPFSEDRCRVGFTALQGRLAMVPEPGGRVGARDDRDQSALRAFARAYPYRLIKRGTSCATRSPGF
jgi:hypothetical protein